jgi:hypothetical protein
MTVTLDHGAAFIQDYYFCVVDYTGYDTGTPTGATATGTDADGLGTGAITLSGTPAATSQVIAAVMHTVNSGVVTSTEGSGWTELSDDNVSAWSHMETQVKLNVGGTTVSWTEIGATGTPDTAVMCALEILEAGGGGGGGGLPVEADPYFQVVSAPQRQVVVVWN